MTKKLLPFLLVLGFLIPIQPASASTACKAVKTKVLASEKKILKELSWLKSRPFFVYTMYGRNEIVLAEWNYNYVGKTSADYARMEKFLASNHLSDIWKLGTNNPKCFTNTQKIRLKEPNFQKTRYLIDWQLFDTPGEATTGMTDAEWLDKHWVFKVNDFKSIYKY
jgi:hypothetical protein